MRPVRVLAAAVGADLRRAEGHRDAEEETESGAHQSFATVFISEPVYSPVHDPQFVEIV